MPRGACDALSRYARSAGADVHVPDLSAVRRRWLLLAGVKCGAAEIIFSLTFRIFVVELSEERVLFRREYPFF